MFRHWRRRHILMTDHSRWIGGASAGLLAMLFLVLPWRSARRLNLRSILVVSWLLHRRDGGIAATLVHCSLLRRCMDDIISTRMFAVFALRRAGMRRDDGLSVR